MIIDNGHQFLLGKNGHFFFLREAVELNQMTQTSHLLDSHPEEWTYKEDTFCLKSFYILNWISNLWCFRCMSMCVPAVCVCLYFSECIKVVGGKAAFQSLWSWEPTICCSHNTEWNLVYYIRDGRLFLKNLFEGQKNIFFCTWAVIK